jgi:hypothetical protein
VPTLRPAPLGEAGDDVVVGSTDSVRIVNASWRVAELTVDGAITWTDAAPIHLVGRSRRRVADNVRAAQ